MCRYALSLLGRCSHFQRGISRRTKCASATEERARTPSGSGSADGVALLARVETELPAIVRALERGEALVEVV